MLIITLSSVTSIIALSTAVVTNFCYKLDPPLFYTLYNFSTQYSSMCVLLVVVGLHIRMGNYDHIREPLDLKYCNRKKAICLCMCALLCVSYCAKANYRVHGQAGTPSYIAPNKQVTPEVVRNQVTTRTLNICY